MKTRNRLYYKSRLRLLCLLTALLGLFGAGQTWAGNPTTLTVGGTNVQSGGYWLTNADGTLTSDGASADNYNVHYDGNGTLTLKDATIKGTNTIGHVGTGIYAEGDLTIVLEGSSTVTGVQDPNGDSQSIRVSENLTIQGGGSLTAQGAETSSGSSYGIFVIGSFTQQGGSVTASGGNVSGNYNSTGLYVYGSTVTVQGGTLTATGGTTGSGSYGISANGSVTVSDATVTATSGSAGYASYGLYIGSSSPSVTLSGSSSLTARSGTATSEAGGIYLDNPRGSTGSVTVGDNSTLLTNSVILYDNSFEAKPLTPTGNGSWLIYGQSDQTSAVGGNYTLTDDLTIENGNTFTIPAGGTLTVPQGKTLTVDGTLTNQGTLSIAAESCLTGSGSLEGDGSFTAVAVTGIEVPDDVTCADYEKKVVLAGPTVLGHAFTADGWTLTFTKGEVTLDGCTYTVTASKEGSESIEKTFTAQHSFGEDGKCPCGASRPTQDAEGCYQVADAFQLFWFAGLVNGTLTDGTAQNTAAWATLTDDIDLSGEAWTPIGNYSASSSLKYTGTFDGAGHTISNLTTVDNSSSNYQGFVGYLGTNGVIKNLTLDESCSVAGYYYVGGICGYNSGTTENCANTYTVTGEQYVGGVCGYNEEGTITNCANGGAVTSTYQYVGGVCGENNNGTIESCYNTGAVNGDFYVGGVCGENNNGTIESCYNTGAVNGDFYAGGVCGANSGTIKSCYWLNTAYSGNGIGISLGSETNVASKTVDQFASGEVAYLLQGSQTTQAWGQTLGTDNYPVLTTDEAKRVYAAKMYNGSAAATDVYAATSGFSRPEGSNALCVIENAPSASAGTNVVVKSGDAYTCANLVLTDGADFYTPVAFTATQATYSRLLAEGTQWGTVALPFDATTVTGAELFRVNRQEGNTLYVDETNGMAGGEPLVFRANAEVTTVDFKGTEVAVRATDAEAGSTLLKGTSQTVSQLDEGAYFIYGDQFYQVASGSQVGVKPFRAYIPAAAGASTRSAGAASQLRIVFNASETIRTAHEGK